MVSLLIALLVLIVVCGLALYLIDMLPIDGRFRQILKVVVILIAIVVLIQRAGYLG